MRTVRFLPTVLAWGALVAALGGCLRPGGMARATGPQGLNVVEMGADPTGAKDCTRLLQEIHARQQRIYYPNGTYRFNGKTLDLSGGVQFETPTGVTVRNDTSPRSILQFDDAGNLVGLQQNHLELNEAKLGGALPTECGSLVRPPVSRREIRRKVDLLAHWYNDFGLEARRARPGSGWIGWYYWTWNFHGADGDDYDPARHPLLGFYRGDDPVVLDWQCYWLREYGVAGVILTGDGDLEGWEAPTHEAHWAYQLFTNTPNFRGLRYVMTASTPYAASTPEVMARVERQWRDLLARTYFVHPNSYSIRRGGKEYPLVFLYEEAGLSGVFDNYNGCAGTLAFYRRMAGLFRERGFGGMALLCRHGLPEQQADFAALEADGVIHLSGSYAESHSTGATYGELVANYAPPTDPRSIVNTVTAAHSHTPHPSKWLCSGHRPELFGEELRKAVAHVQTHDMLRIVTCYNVAEWAEGGPGLQPNMQDRFGYLDAVKAAVVLPPDAPPRERSVFRP